MSSVLSKKPPLAEPSFDLDYSLEEFEADPALDSRFLFRRIEQAMVREGLATGGRTLDVACGAGQIVTRIQEHGVDGWGLDPSLGMLSLHRYLFSQDRIVLIRGIGESLPFQDGTFDRVLCQGALDHFVHPQTFMREAARITRPDGRVIVALTNYAGLSCRLGPLLERVGQLFFHHTPLPHRPYWQPPPDHFHKGDLPFILRLGGESLQLERCYGVSLLWLLRGWGDWRWGTWLEEIPRPLAHTMLVILDRIAHKTPELADMVISVWRPCTDKES